MLVLFYFLVDLQAKCSTSNQKNELKWNCGITHESCIIYLRLSESEGFLLGEPVMQESTLSPEMVLEL